MPADYPVIFLAFAQAPQSAPLELKQERKGIRSVLEALHDKRFIELDGEPSTDVDDIFKAFTRYAGRLTIFHYAGHAGQSLLELEDAHAHAKGLSQLFGEAKDSLRLVFLNGCSTYGQVELLHEAGIKAVIATSRPVGDDIAKRFAIEFYSQLANHRTLEQAFNRAAALLQTLRQGFDCRIHRGVSQFSKAEQAALPPNFPISNFPISNLPWGLYVREGSDEVLQWTLPKIYVEPPPLPKRDASFDDGLVRVVEEMAKFNQVIGAKSPNERRTKARQLVLENFPWLISAHLQILYAGGNGVRQHGMPRLQQLVEIYVVTTRLMSFVLLSQLWDEIMRRGNLEGLDEFAPTLPTEENYDTFDYLHLLRSCNALLEANGLKPFIPGLSGSAERTGAGGESFELYRFFEALRSRLSLGDVSVQEAPALSREAENVLVELFVRVAYLAGFKLLTIPNIRLNYPKSMAKFFNHEHFLLYTAQIGFVTIDEKPFSGFKHSHSILLFPHTQADIKDFEPDSSLDLSPFYMDKATWLGKDAPAIYAFTYRREDGSLRYQSVDYDPSDRFADLEDWELLLDSTTEYYRVVHTQFNHFLTDFNLTP